MCNIIIAQENNDEVYSVYFTKEAFSNFKQVTAVSNSQFGKFQPETSEKNQMRLAAGEFLITDETGIYIQKNKLLFITREQVREESKYEVRNGYLFGVVKNDSVPVALDGERYYFLIPSKTYLFENNNSVCLLLQMNNSSEYVIATKEENGYYTIILVRFGVGKVSMCELIFSVKSCSFDDVKKKEITKGEFNTYIMTPTKDEWSKLISCFVSYDNYEKIN